MASGTVKWFNAQKGFGFIQPESGGKDVFVHISAVERAGLNGLNEGQKISYEVQTERGKEAAVNLKACGSEALSLGGGLGRRFLFEGTLEVAVLPAGAGRAVSGAPLTN